MAEKNACLDLRLKKIDETKDYFSEEIKHNELISKKHKTVCTTLYYIEHLLTLVSSVTGRVLITPGITAAI